MSDATNTDLTSQPTLDEPVAAPAEPRATPATGDQPISVLPLNEADTPNMPPASPLLRLWRTLAAVGALGAAWGLLVLLLVVGNAAWGFARSSHALALRVVVSAGALVGALWLSVAMIACVIAGAYCLMLAITRRSW